MKKLTLFLLSCLIVIFLVENTNAQEPIEAGDPPNPTDIPDFYKSKLSDIDQEIMNLKTGKAKVVAAAGSFRPRATCPFMRRVHWSAFSMVRSMSVGSNGFKW